MKNLFDNDQQEANLWQKIVTLFMRINRKVRIVFSIIAITLLFIMLLIVFKPEAQKRDIPETVVRVNVVEAVRSSYPIIVQANGTIAAETRGNLVTQVSGEIVRVAPNFNAGGTFNKGDELVYIDPRDFQANLSQALAQLSQAQASYRQEQANAKQAKLDWVRLGNTDPAPDLVLRKPQLAAAKAQLDSAQAAYESAQLSLSRTTIKAPYNGRVIRRDAVLGQYVTQGSPVAEIFATDGVEVRLPISQNEFNQLGFDAQNTNESAPNSFQVTVSSDIGTHTYRWNAEITRTDSAFDINTRQINIFAKVIDPFGKQNGQPPLKIGQFVNARIQGRQVDNVFVIPNKSIREGRYIYVVRDGRLAKLTIDILWQDDQNALINRGIDLNEKVVTTSLNSTLAGARAELVGDDDNTEGQSEQSNHSSDTNNSQPELIQSAIKPANSEPAEADTN